jgi:hypothetical protein
MSFYTPIHQDFLLQSTNLIIPRIIRKYSEVFTQLYSKFRLNQANVNYPFEWNCENLWCPLLSLWRTHQNKAVIRFTTKFYTEKLCIHPTEYTDREMTLRTSRPIISVIVWRDIHWSFLRFHANEMKIWLNCDGLTDGSNRWQLNARFSWLL